MERISLLGNASVSTCKSFTSGSAGVPPAQRVLRTSLDYCGIRNPILEAGGTPALPPVMSVFASTNAICICAHRSVTLLDFTVNRRSVHAKTRYLHFGRRMFGIPGRSYQGPMPSLNEIEQELSRNLSDHVWMLAGDIGARSLTSAPENLEKAAQYIEHVWKRYGYLPENQEFTAETFTHKRRETSGDNRNFPVSSKQGKSQNKKHNRGVTWRRFNERMHYSGRSLRFCF